MLPRRTPPAACLALIACLSLAACATIPVHTDYDGTVEFLFYRTFAVVPPRDREPAVESLGEARVRQAIVAGLTAKGLAEVPRPEADLLARWRMRTRERLVVDEVFGPPFWRRPYRRTQVYPVREGTLTIELVDRERARVVWEGTATGVVDDPARNRETIRRAVARILEQYPPPHG